MPCAPGQLVKRNSVNYRHLARDSHTQKQPQVQLRKYGEVQR
nr:MAG TPA: hypothetical protein [Caudoviricetes sp.]